MAKQPTAVTLHFRTVARGNRKSCPNCKAKLATGESVWSWGEYIRAKWHNVADFCRECFDTVVLAKAFDHQPHRPKAISVHGGGQPDWMTLEPVYHPELVDMLATCNANLDDFHQRQVTADACEDSFYKFHLATGLRAQAQAYQWAVKTKMCERSTVVVTIDDFKYGKCPRQRLPFSLFNGIKGLHAILLACGPPHAFGFEVVDSLESAKNTTACWTDAPTPLIFCDNGGWYRDPERNLRPFTADYCYFVRPIMQDRWPELMADLVATPYPRHEGDACDGRKPARVWKRSNYRLEGYLQDFDYDNGHNQALAYRLYDHDNLVSRSFNIGCPKLIQPDSDDALVGVMHHAVHSMARDEVAVGWHTAPRAQTFRRMVAGLRQLFDASKSQDEFSTWCCPAGLVVGHQVMDCEACWNAFVDRTNRERQRNEEGAAEAAGS